MFGSSVELGRPLEFLIGVGMVIRGWDEGMMKMSVGEKVSRGRQIQMHAYRCS